jgi:rubredoxin
MSKDKWKIGESGATEVIKANVAFYDKMRRILTRRCKAPDCGYVISAADESFALPGIGSVCGVCYFMYEALMGIPSYGLPGLKNPYYFRSLHEQWVMEKSDPKRRDRLGL